MRIVTKRLVWHQNKLYWGHFPSA